MKRRFELVDPSRNHNKFWEVDVKGSAVTTWWGRIGQAAAQKTKDFGSPEKAKAAAEKLVAEKKAKGYVTAPVTQKASKDKPRKASKGKASKGKASKDKRCERCGRPDGWTQCSHDVSGCKCRECVSMCWGDPVDCANARGRKSGKKQATEDLLAVDFGDAPKKGVRRRKLTAMEVKILKLWGFSDSQIATMSLRNVKKEVKLFKQTHTKEEIKRLLGKKGKPKTRPTDVIDKYRQSLTKGGVHVATFDAVGYGDGPSPLQFICGLVKRHAKSEAAKFMIDHGRFTDGKREILVVPPSAEHAKDLCSSLDAAKNAVEGDTLVSEWMDEVVADIRQKFGLKV